MQTIMEIGDAVYQGGSQHILHKYAKSDYSFQYSHMTLRGGDYQAMDTTGGILYAVVPLQRMGLQRTRTPGRTRPTTRGWSRSA